jgi:cytidylate kinase
MSGDPHGVPKRGPVVAIDGPAGAGKSTLAGALAEELGLPYINTGVMYRSVAARALQRGVDPADVEALSRLAGELVFSLDDGSPRGLLIDGRPVGNDLTSAEVEQVVSMVARHPEVRSVLRAEQRRLGAGGSVIEGRDIGTVVFPDADVKVFLRAEPDERAGRRQAERRSSDPALAEALERRDSLDARTNPLVPAPDAHPVDTTGRDPQEVLAEVLQLVRPSIDKSVPPTA